jgi:hydroxymethylglutaryl-CoA lyase
VLHCVQDLLNMGCYEVSLGDTLGVGSPDKVRSLLRYLVDHDIPLDKMAGHFHDTYGQAVANVWEAYNCGVRVFDSSVGGLGGCPYAPGAKGNVATEDLVYMFETSGINTGVDLLKLVETGVWISGRLTKTNASRAGAALALKHGLVSSKRSSSRTTNKKSIAWSMIKDTNGLLAYRSGVIVKPTLNRPKKRKAFTSETSQPSPPSSDSSSQEQDDSSAQAWISARDIHL